jgi:broad specificity phosphatase PhoE
MRLFLLMATAALGVGCSSSHYHYIVRHAEKLDNTPYSALSAVGHQRAAVLKDSLKGKGIDIIFATPFVRTQETARPLATALTIPIAIYRQNAIDSIAEVLNRNTNKDILLVGHSGSIPGIIEKFTNQKVPKIEEEQYDNFYVIKIKGDKKSLAIKTYGRSGH